MDRFLDENESAASSRAGSPGRAHIGQSNLVTTEEDVPVARAHVQQSNITTENVTAMLNRPSPSDGHYSSSSMMSGLIRVPQLYVPTPVIVSNDKEPPTKKPNLGHNESMIMANGPPPLKPNDNTTMRSHITSHMANNVSSHMTTSQPTSHVTSHMPSHMTNHTMHVPTQLATGINPTAATSLPNSGLQFPSLNTRPQHHLNMHNIESGNTYTRLTQNS